MGTVKTFAIERSDGTIVMMHPACARDPAYWEGYNDAKDGLDYDIMLLGGTNVEAEEYRAGYLQACAEIAHGVERHGCNSK
jgi:hypothetical protein